MCTSKLSKYYYYYTFIPGVPSHHNREWYHERTTLATTFWRLSSRIPWHTAARWRWSVCTSHLAVGTSSSSTKARTNVDVELVDQFFFCMIPSDSELLIVTPNRGKVAKLADFNQ